MYYPQRRRGCVLFGCCLPLGCRDSAQLPSLPRPEVCPHPFLVNFRAHLSLETLSSSVACHSSGAKPHTSRMVSRTLWVCSARCHGGWASACSRSWAPVALVGVHSPATGPHGAVAAAPQWLPRWKGQVSLFNLREPSENRCWIRAGDQQGEVLPGLGSARENAAVVTLNLRLFRKGVCAHLRTRDSRAACTLNQSRRGRQCQSASRLSCHLQAK